MHLRRREALEQDVVLGVDVRHQVLAEGAQARVERAPGGAGAGRRGDAAGQRLQAGAGRRRGRRAPGASPPIGPWRSCRPEALARSGGTAPCSSLLHVAAPAPAAMACRWSARPCGQVGAVGMHHAPRLTRQPHQLGQLLAVHARGSGCRRWIDELGGRWPARQSRFGAAPAFAAAGPASSAGDGPGCQMPGRHHPRRVAACWLPAAAEVEAGARRTARVAPGMRRARSPSDWSR
jgi:hypothetical protein